MNLHDLLHETNNHFLDTLQRMLKNGKPLVLLGAGELGQMTWDFLARNSVTVDHVAINCQYIEPDMRFHHLPILAIEEMVKKPQRYNYIFAFNVEPKKISSSMYSNAEEMLIFDHGFIGVNTTEYFTPKFCELHAAAFNDFYHQLMDERSRITMVAFINQRLCARRSYYRDVYEPVHYFPEDIIRLIENEVFIDCGAYNGDSIELFMQNLDKQNIGKPECIIGFEPDAENFDKLKSNTQHLSFCECLQKGVWNKKSILHFQSGKQQGSRVAKESERTISIQLCSIDDTLAGGKATFIKMDIEGVELKALEGASETIKKHHPLLAISVYHKPDDLITIPQYIKSLYPEYSFFLRGHSPELAMELVLYAIPPERIISS